MPDSSEILRALGGIESTVAETKQKVDSLFIKLDKVNEEVIEQRGGMKMLALTCAEIKTAHDGLAVRVKEDIVPVLEEYTNGKNRLLGAIFGTGIAGGGLGTGLLLWVSKLLGLAPAVPPPHP